MAGAELPSESATVTGESDRHLQSLAAGIEARERSLLASAIHDDPMQLIVASMLQIDYLRMSPSGDDEDAWEKVIGMLETSVERLRRLIDAISPADLADGLVEALRNLAGGIFMGTATTVSVHGEPGIRLPAPQEQLAHQVLRGALVSVREHSYGGSVVLDLERQDVLVATLTGDGIEDGSPTRSGLAGLQAVVSAAGGELRIDGLPGGGIRMTLRLAPC